MERSGMKNLIIVNIKTLHPAAAGFSVTNISYVTRTKCQGETD